MIFIEILLISAVSILGAESFLISLENMTFPLLITCNDDFCILDEFNETLQIENENENLLQNVQFTGVCQDNNDCPRLQVCENTGCTSPSLGCTSDSECFNGDFCLHGLCSNVVSCDQGCSGGTICLEGLCLPPPSSGATSTVSPTSTTTSTVSPTSTTSTVSPTSTTTSTVSPTSTMTMPTSTPCSTTSTLRYY